MSPASKPVRRTVAEKMWFIFVGTYKYAEIYQGDTRDDAERAWLKAAYGSIAKMARARGINETEAEELYVAKSVLSPMAYSAGDVAPMALSEEEFNRLRTELRSRGLDLVNEGHPEGHAVTEGTNR